MSRLRRFILALLMVPAAVTSCSGCRTPLENATAQPRDGRLLNGRAAVVYSSRYEINLWGLEKTHTFDIHKYRKMAQSLVDQGYLAADDFFVPGEIDRSSLLLVHEPAYLEKLKSSRNVSGYLENGAVALMPGGLTDAAILRAFRCSTAGTILAARQALRCGLGINLGGGYHHAHADHGAGFCIYADVPIAVRALQREGLVRRVLLVDLDAHQGDGNARIFAGDPTVFIMDVHDATIYPTPKAAPTLNLGLFGRVEDEEYLKVLADHLPGVLDEFRPDLVVLLAGVDPYYKDPLGHLALSAAAIAHRDAYVVGEARRRNLPLLYVTSGGYSPEAWQVQCQSIANLLHLYAGVTPR